MPASLTSLPARIERARSLRRLRRRATLDVHPTAVIGRVSVAGRGRRGHLSIGARSVVEDGVIVRIHDGGRIELGDDVTLRSGAVLNVTGHLRLAGRNLLSWYSVIHCAESVVFDELAGTGEGVTVVDSNHFHGERGASDEHWYHNHRAEPVVIGRNTWLAARSTVTAGARLGEACTVAAGAVVLRGDHPDGATLVGATTRRLER